MTTFVLLGWWILVFLWSKWWSCLYIHIRWSTYTCMTMLAITSLSHFHHIPNITFPATYIVTATRSEAKAKIQSAFSSNIDPRYYCRNRLMYTSLDKTSNSKNSKIEESKPKAQESKTANSNNSLCSNQGKNAKTSDKTLKKIKKYWRQEKREKKNFNSGILASKVNIRSNFNRKKSIQMDLS